MLKINEPKHLFQEKILKLLEANANFSFDEHYLESKIISNRYIKKKEMELR